MASSEGFKMPDKRFESAQRIQDVESSFRQFDHNKWATSATRWKTENKADN